MQNFISGQVIMLNIQARIIPVDKPGLYRWYANEDDFRNLISSPYLDGVKNGRDYAQELLNLKNNPSNTANKQLAEYKDPVTGVTYYGIYFGKASESLRQRIALNHVNGFANGYIKKDQSTLRTAVSTLIFDRKEDEDKITEFIGRLGVLIYPYGGPLATNAERDSAKDRIKNVEKRGIAKYISPLNMQSNDVNKNICDPLKDFMKDYKKLRDSITWKP